MVRHNFEDRSRLLTNSVMSNECVARMYGLIKDKRPKVADHCSNVAFITGQVCLALGLEHGLRKEIICGALLHDLGKIETPIQILDKPSLLTKEEYDKIKEHPRDGLKILRQHCNLSETIEDIILHHHENEKGAGYPDGVTTMSLGAQIVSIVDKYDAITEQRVYAPAVNQYDTYVLLREEKENFTYFDQIIKALFESEGK